MTDDVALTSEQKEVIKEVVGDSFRDIVDLLRENIQADINEGTLPDELLDAAVEYAVEQVKLNIHDLRSA